ncbi:MAG TPA: methyltransferase [Candidatus Binatia bacterium]
MDFSQLIGLAGGYAEARAIQAAVEIGLFDALEDSKDAEDVARTIHCDPRATELLLDALVAIGLMAKKGSFYSLTETSAAYLLKSAPKYLGGMIRFDASLWECWGGLEAALRTGKPARPPDVYQGDKAETERFIGAMDSLVRARGDAEAVLRYLDDRLDLSEVSELLDVGSGPATYPIAFCRKHVSLRAAIFDLPATLKVTEGFVRAANLSDRIKLVPGDYRSDAIPGRYQLAFLSNIIHGEGPEENQRLMAKLYGSLEKGGSLVIKDHILDDSRTGPASGAVFSLLMLLTTAQGRCYSFTEAKGWLEKAGFREIRETRLPAPLTSSLVVGVKL